MGKLTEIASGFTGSPQPPKSDEPLCLPLVLRVATAGYNAYGRIKQGFYDFCGIEYTISDGRDSWSPAFPTRQITRVTNKPNYR